MIIIEDCIVKPTLVTFSEEGYLMKNPDVKNAINQGIFRNGYEHFELHGEKESRLQFNTSRLEEIKQIRQKKLKRANLNFNMEHFILKENKYSFLSEELRDRYHAQDSATASSNGYDKLWRDIVEKNKDGILLDCGAGMRNAYYSNIVNFEIANYWSTDVLGVGEHLPFTDNTFDAVISVAVLEHVKDPFACSKEIIRVLKPGGTLFSAIPFLQPYHGYPHHYYNMTHQGHANLYEDHLVDMQIQVIDSLKPVYSLTWMLREWLKGLPDKTKHEFLKMKVSDLISDPSSYLEKDFVNHLSSEANFTIASGTLIIGEKKTR